MDRNPQHVMARSAVQEDLLWRGPRSKKTCYGAVRGPRSRGEGGGGEMAVNGWLGGRQAAGYSVALADFGWRASKRAVRGPQSWQTRGPRSTELAKARSAVHEPGHDFTKARYAVQMDRDPASNLSYKHEQNESHSCTRVFQLEFRCES